MEMDNPNLSTLLTEGDVDGLENLFQSGVNINAYCGIHTPLARVSELGHVECVKALIASGADVNKRDIFYHTPLMRAAKLAQLECMRVLIAAKADVNYQNHETFALFISAIEGHVEGVQLLIDNGADVSMTTSKGISILPIVLESIMFEDELVMKIIERHTINNMKNELGLSLIMIAAQRGRVACLEMLLNDCDTIDDIDRNGKTALMHASANGHVDCLVKLIQSGADVNFDSSVPKPRKTPRRFRTETSKPEESPKTVLKMTTRTAGTPLMLASSSGHVDCVLKLLEMGADVNKKTCYEVTALTHASDSGHLPCIEALVEAGADVNLKIDSPSPIQRAAKQGHTDCVNYLVKNGADLNERTTSQTTLLHLVLSNSKNDDRELTGILLKGGLDVNAKSSFDGKTPLMCAAENGCVDSLDLLLSEKVNVNDVNFLGETALFFAVMYGHVAVIEKLIKSGADINLINKFGSSPLSTGCKFGKLDCVKILIKNGAVIDNDAEGSIDQALSISLQTGHLDCFHFLLENGADPNFKNKYGGTILHTILDSETYSFELFKTLIKHGAVISFADDKGMTLLMLAAKHGHLSSLNFLLENNTNNIDEKDEHGWCAAKYAVAGGSDTCLLNLLNAGSYITHTEKDLKHLITIAALKNRISCVKIIGEHLRNMTHDGDFIIPRLSKTRLRENSFNMLVSLAEYGFISYDDLKEVLSFCELVKVRTTRSEKVIFLEENEKKLILTPFQASFKRGEKGAVYYSLANLFLSEGDIRCIFSDSFLEGVESNVEDMKEIRNQITQSPWSLQTLSFIVISSRIKPFIMNEERKKAVDNLYLPERFSKRLKFYDNMAQLCPDDWTSMLSRSPGLEYLLKVPTPNWLQNETVTCKKKHCCNGKGFRLKTFADEESSETDDDDESDSEVRTENRPFVYI